MADELTHTDGSRARILTKDIALNGSCIVQHWSTQALMDTPPADPTALRHACIAFTVYLTADLSGMGDAAIAKDVAIQKALYDALFTYTGEIRDGLQIIPDFSAAGGWSQPA